MCRRRRSSPGVVILGTIYTPQNSQCVVPISPQRTQLAARSAVWPAPLPCAPQQAPYSYAQAPRYQSSPNTFPNRSFSPPFCGQPLAPSFGMNCTSPFGYSGNLSLSNDFYNHQLAARTNLYSNSFYNFSRF